MARGPGGLEGLLQWAGYRRIGAKELLAAIPPTHGANSRIEYTTTLVMRLSAQPESWCEVAISSRMTRCGAPAACEPDTHVPSVAGVDVVVGLAHLCGDATAVRNLKALLAGPLANLLSVRRAAGTTTTGATAAAGATSLSDPFLKGLTKSSCMLVVQVDLVGDAIKGEGDGLIGLGPVDIVDEDDLSLLCHDSSF